MLKPEDVKKAFRAAYNLYEKYPAPVHEAGFFDRVSDEIDSMARENPGNDLMPYLLMAVYNYLDHASGEGQK